MKVRLLMLVVALIPTPGLAETSAQIHTEQTQNIHTAEQNAEHWSLTEDQWKRYTTYMEMEGRYFYQHLDPVFVSGLIAETEAERQRLAERYAEQEFERNKRLIAFNDAFESAFNRKYGHLDKLSVEKYYQKYGGGELQPIASPIQAGDHIAVFVKRDCTRCDAAISKHYAALKHHPEGVKLDIFFVDSPSDVDIQRWARQLNIGIDTVRQRTVTLNRDTARYQEYGSPELPTVYLLRNREVIGSL